MQIIKRNGQVAEFDPDKIYQAILKAAQTVYVLDDTWRQNLAQVTKKVVLDLQDAQVERPTTVSYTHLTMSAADSIYGVTMQESGVSKIVSVKLKDLDLD